jgi:fucose permease
VLPPILGAIAHTSGSLALGYIVVVAAYIAILGYCLLQGRDVSLKSIERAPEVL